jgi:CheY-like chemotaxis protein
MMHSLTEMDSDVVLPLVAALGSDDAFLRRNVALTLGYIADPRAAAALTWVALNDEDPGVEMAAKAAAIKCGSSGDPLPLFEQLGDDYHHGRGNVLRAHFHSDVVWSWGDDGLTAAPVPRALYADELAKGAYYDALGVDPGSIAARAGLARAYVSQQAEMAARMEAGMDGEGVEDQLAEAAIAVNTAGVSALDLALSWSAESGDVQTGIELCRVLGELAPEPTSGLGVALGSADGGLAAEAALALGNIAFNNGRGASSATTAGLGRAAGLEVLRMAVVIDSDAERGAALTDALSGSGMIATHWNSGAKGLALLHRVPGVDAILVADQLDDLTAAQVLDSVRGNERTASVPVFMISGDAQAGDMYDGVAATISGPDGVAAVEEGMSAGLGHDRDQANDLAARAATTLAALAYGAGGGDISPAVDGLASTLAARPDSVTIPAMRALSAGGRAAQIPALLAVLGDSGRSDGARTAAADALAGIAGRERLSANADILAVLAGVLDSDASLAVRMAASRALGRLGMDASQRAGFTHGTRVNVSQ